MSGLSKLTVNLSRKTSTCFIVLPSFVNGIGGTVDRHYHVLMGSKYRRTPMDFCACQPCIKDNISVSNIQHRCINKVRKDFTRNGGTGILSSHNQGISDCDKRCTFPSVLSGKMSSPIPINFRERSTRSQDTIMNVFDRRAKRLHKDRAALSYIGDDVSVYDYLKDEFGYRLSDRMCDIKRVFKTAVDLGCGRGHLSKNIYGDMVESLYQCEFSTEMLIRAEVSPEVPTHKLIVDEEFLPFRDNSLDIVVSNLSLHWVNDLPRCLKQILQALKSDGAFLGSMFGGDTLYELRVSLQLAEEEREGGFAPHISPYTTVNDLGNLLTRAGFTMLTIDIDDVTINYPSIFELMYDLKGMAENNCAWSRKPQLHRDSLIAAASIYKEMYGNEHGVPATFQVINFIGWKPDPSQPKAAKRGSATVSIKDIGKLDEITKQMEEIQKKKESNNKAKEKLNEELQTLAKKYKDPK